MADTPAQQFPKVEGETLGGHKITLPDATAGKVAVLILGFSKPSRTATLAWGKRINADFAGQQGFELYQLPVLEDVPRLIRGMVVSAINRDVPENQHDHFLPVLHREAELKRLVSYRQKDDAYILLLSRAGMIEYQMHANSEVAAYAELRRRIEQMLNDHE